MIHDNYAVDVVVDKLSSALEVRLRHTGCTRDHFKKPTHGEMQLGKIIRLRTPTSSIQTDDSICSYYSNPSQASSVTENSMVLYKLGSFINILFFLDYFASLQDEYDIREIMAERERIITKELSGAWVVNKKDNFKIRSCLKKIKDFDVEVEKMNLY